MRTRAALGGIFASATILVVGWQAGTVVIHNQTATARVSATAATPTATPTPATKPATTPAPTTSTPTSTATTTPSTTKPATPAATSGTFTGSSIPTRYGNVQVEIIVVSGKITNVIALHLTTDGGRSVEISNQAAPILRSEILASQSANVASVSGATYTSDGYLSSLQSALDQAKL